MVLTCLSTCTSKTALGITSGQGLRALAACFFALLQLFGAPVPHPTFTAKCGGAFCRVIYHLHHPGTISWHCRKSCARPSSDQSCHRRVQSRSLLRPVDLLSVLPLHGWPCPRGLRNLGSAQDHKSTRMGNFESDAAQDHLAGNNPARDLAADCHSPRCDSSVASK
jgi:hypothetical protein